MANAVAKGRIKKNSEEFDEMKASIDKVSEAILEAKKNIEEFNNAIRQLNWDQFDRGQEWISDLSSELDFMNQLLDTGQAYDKQGHVTDEGIARYGTMAMDYDVQMQQAQYYASEIKKINKDLAKDPYNLALIDRKRELVKAQQESILAAKKEKEAMRDLVKEGIEAQINALSELIDNYTKMLDTNSDALDYARQVAEQSAEIEKYRKQVQSWEGDTSEEGAARRQQTSEELRKAEEELAQTQEEKRIAEIKASLTELQDNFSEVLNSRLDNLDMLISSVIDGVNLNAITIADTINQASTNVGYTLSTQLRTSLSDARSQLVAAIQSAGLNLKSAIDMFKSGNITAINGLKPNIDNVKNSNSTAINTLKTSNVNEFLKLGTKFNPLVSNFSNGAFKTNDATILQQVKTIVDNVKVMGDNAKVEANKRIQEENARKAQAAAQAAAAQQKAQQQAAAAAKAKTTTSSTPAAAAKATLTDDIKRHVAAAIWNGNYGWGTDPDRAKKLTEVFGANNGIQALVNQGVGMTGISPAGYSYAEMRKKFKGYYTGAKKIPKNQLAFTQEHGREYIEHNGKILTPLSEGDSVFNRLASDNLWNFANHPEDFISSKFDALEGMGAISNYGGNNVNMTFNLSGMKDPEVFMMELQRNKQFAELVQELTLGQANGHGKLAKNSIRF